MTVAAKKPAKTTTPKEAIKPKGVATSRGTSGGAKTGGAKTGGTKTGGAKTSGAKTSGEAGLRIWVLSDGTAGMRFQAVAVADGIAAARPGTTDQPTIIEDYIAPPHRLLRSLPAWGNYLSYLPFLPLFASSTKDDATPPPAIRQGSDYPDILITCGRRMAGISIALRARARRRGAAMQTIHIQDPRLAPSLFDALVLPSHDPTRGDNVVVMLGSLNRLTPARIAEAAKTLPPTWLDRSSHAPVAVMLGGDNGRYRITRKMVAHMAMELGKFAQMTWINDNPVRFLLVPSRRTPPELLDQLGLALGDIPYEVAPPDMANPYPGILAADAIIVTADSVNMVSEAAIMGSPLLVAGWRPDDADSCSGETGRIGLFHRAMIAGGHSAIISPYAETEGYTALDERPRVITQLLTLLGR